jgi:hypothetical protein
LAESQVVPNTEAGEVTPPSPIISVERTIDLNTKTKKWRIITTKLLLKEAHEKVTRILVGKGMQTEYFAQHKSTTKNHWYKPARMDNTARYQTHTE